MKQTGTVDARQLSTAEWSLLDGLLSRGVRDGDRLRGQLDDVAVVSSCDCGCGSLGFVHPGQVQPDDEPRVLWSAECEVLDEAGEPIGGVILFTRGGLLDDLEVHSFGDPLALPNVDNVRWRVVER